MNPQSPDESIAFLRARGWPDVDLVLDAVERGDKLTASEFRVMEERAHKIYGNGSASSELKRLRRRMERGHAVDPDELARRTKRVAEQDEELGHLLAVINASRAARVVEPRWVEHSRGGWLHWRRDCEMAVSVEERTDDVTLTRQCGKCMPTRQPVNPTLFGSRLTYSVLYKRGTGMTQ